MRTASIAALAALLLVACASDDTGQKSATTAPPLTADAKADAPAHKPPGDPHAQPRPDDPHAGLPADHPPIPVDAPPPPGASPGLGITPSYEGDGSGLGITSVRADGAAAVAGIVEGDVIVKLAGVEVGDVYDYMAALGTVKVGEKVDIVVRRQGELKTLSVVMGESRR